MPIGFLVTSRSIFETQMAIGRSIGFSEARPRIACISSANCDKVWIWSSIVRVGPLGDLGRVEEQRESLAEQGPAAEFARVDVKLPHLAGEVEEVDHRLVGAERVGVVDVEGQRVGQAVPARRSGRAPGRRRARRWTSSIERGVLARGDLPDRGGDRDIGVLDLVIEHDQPVRLAAGPDAHGREAEPVLPDVILADLVIASIAHLQAKRGLAVVIARFRRGEVERIQVEAPRALPALLVQLAAAAAADEVSGTMAARMKNPQVTRRIKLLVRASSLLPIRKALRLAASLVRAASIRAASVMAWVVIRCCDPQILKAFLNLGLDSLVCFTSDFCVAVSGLRPNAALSRRTPPPAASPPARWRRRSTASARRAAAATDRVLPSAQRPYRRGPRSFPPIWEGSPSHPWSRAPHRDRQRGAVRSQR